MEKVIIIAVIALIIIIALIISYRLGKALTVAIFIYTIPPEMLKDSISSMEEFVSSKKMIGATEADKIKWKLIVRNCIKKFVFE